MPDQVGAQSRDAWARRYLPVQRPMWKKFITPLVLAGAGVVLFLLGVWAYPSASAGLSTPPFTGVEIVGPPDLELHYSVDQVQPNLASIQFVLFGSTLPADAVLVRVGLPLGDTFLHCRTDCGRTGGTEILVRRAKFDWDGKATLTFLVRARNFNLASNGVNASAAIPDILWIIASEYHHPSRYKNSKGLLIAKYRLSSPNSYDWSTSPPASISDSKSSIAWTDPLTIGNNKGRIAVGTSYGHQASNNTKTFIAGALLGLSLSAILSAIQALLPH